MYLERLGEEGESEGEANGGGCTKIRQHDKKKIPNTSIK